MKLIVFLLACTAYYYALSNACAQDRRAAELKQYPDIAYRLRAFELFQFLADDIQKENAPGSSREEFQRMHEALNLIFHELVEADVFIALDKPLRPDRMERLSPAARAYYEYYRAARVNNPVFRDLYQPLPVDKSTLYQAYRDYQLKGRSEGERRAYEAAVDVIGEIKRPSIGSAYGWLSVGIGALFAIATFGVASLLIRRRFQRRRQRRTEVLKA